LLSVHLEPGPLSEARELGIRRLSNLENGRHCLELFRRRAIYVEPEEAICRKAVRELADLDLKTIKHGCLIGLQASGRAADRVLRTDN